MVNWTQPTISTLYTSVLDDLDDKDIDTATMFDGSSSTNIPTGAYRITNTTGLLERYNGTTWENQDLSIGGDFTVTGNVTGNINFTGSIDFGSNIQLSDYDSANLQIESSATTSGIRLNRSDSTYVGGIAGNISNTYINSPSGELGFRTYANGASQLFYNNIEKLATTNTGVNVTGDLVATTADINGGTVDAVVGGTTPAAGSFTTLTTTGGVDKLKSTTTAIDVSAAAAPAAGEALIATSSTAATWQPLRRENIIINGDFNIWQRGGAFTPISDDYTADRWYHTATGGQAWNVAPDADVPTFAQSGHTSENSLFQECATADTPTGGDFGLLEYKVEGYDTQQLIGNSATLSFWVKASLAGINCVSFRNGGYDRSYVVEYEIDAANTWEKKVITVLFDETGGTWDFETGSGLVITWCLSNGTSYIGATDTWLTGNYLTTANQVNNAATSGNDFRLAQIKFELGEEASLWATVPIPTELARCQRYYEIVPCSKYRAIYTAGGTNFNGEHIFYRVKKRTATPYVTWSHAGATNYWVIPSTAAYSAVSTAGWSVVANSDCFWFENTRQAGNSTPTSGNMYQWEPLITAYVDGDY